MKAELLLYLSSALITLWGIAHIIPIKPVVDGFSAVSVKNRRIIVMEWLSEGLTLCFLGVLVFSVTLLGGKEILVPLLDIDQLPES